MYPIVEIAKVIEQNLESITTSKDGSSSLIINDEEFNSVSGKGGCCNWSFSSELNDNGTVYLQKHFKEAFGLLGYEMLSAEDGSYLTSKFTIKKAA